MFAYCKDFIKDTRGTIAILFALMAPVVVGSVGMALDYSQAYLVQQRLAQALDAAALAAAASSTDPATIEAKVKAFFDANYPEDRLGVVFEPVVVINGNEVTVSGYANYGTSFVGIWGINEIEVAASTTVQREVKGLEVVLVLDNTGSMASNNNIGKLRTAACEFVEILYGTYDSDEVTDCLDRYGEFVEAENEYVKIGLVPYATSVNVGPYGLGYNDAGGNYDTAFLNNPQGLNFSNDSDTDICVIEDDGGSDTQDVEGPWDMYRWCRDTNNDNALCDYRNDYNCTRYNSSGLCSNWKYKKNAKGLYRSENYICPKASILPLSENMTALKNRINEMQANGNTYGNIGMVWGWRVLSDSYPFTEGVSFDNHAWRKVIVMMTDGDNVYSNPYSAYGYRYDNVVNSSSKIDDRLEDVCKHMDEQDDVTVYTITFDVNGGIDDYTEQLYKDCAANGGYHEHVETSDELVNVFREIAQELSNLHIKN